METSIPTGPPGHAVEASREAEEIPFLAPHFEPPVFPWRQIVGYGISLVLTAAALLAVIHHVLPPTGLIIVILCMAVVQAGVRLDHGGVVVPGGVEPVLALLGADLHLHVLLNFDGGAALREGTAATRPDPSGWARVLQ